MGSASLTGGGARAPADEPLDESPPEQPDLRERMTGYMIRRVLWGIALLVIVCALTFMLFRVLPTGNPAVLRAGRDPQPHLIKEIERVLGLNKSLPVQFGDYLKNVFFHFDFGYTYYSQESVVTLIKEPDPGDSVAGGRRGRSGW